MRFAISIPQSVGPDGFDPARFAAYLARAEELGFESGWVGETTFGSSPALGPLETLTFAAACTERLRLGCVVFVTPLRIPVHLAKSIASLDCLSRGRLEVGIGTGGPGRMFPAFGVEKAGFVGRFTEGLAVMKALWTEPSVTFDGRFWQLSGVSMEPKPVQKPHPPIWVGGSHPAALARAVRLADGFFGAGSQPTSAFAQQAQIVREELARAGRDPSTFQLAKRVYIQVDDDPAAASQRIGAALERLYGRRIPEVAVAGSPEDCVAGLRAVADAGAELLLLDIASADVGQMERLAAEVIPALAG